LQGLLIVVGWLWIAPLCGRVKLPSLWQRVTYLRHSWHKNCRAFGFRECLFSFLDFLHLY